MEVGAWGQGGLEDLGWTPRSPGEGPISSPGPQPGSPRLGWISSPSTCPLSHTSNPAAGWATEGGLWTCPWGHGPPVLQHCAECVTCCQLSLACTLPPGPRLPRLCLAQCFHSLPHLLGKVAPMIPRKKTVVASPRPPGQTSVYRPVSPNALLRTSEAMRTLCGCSGAFP